MAQIRLKSRDTPQELDRQNADGTQRAEDTNTRLSDHLGEAALCLFLYIQVTELNICCSEEKSQMISEKHSRMFNNMKQL